MLKLMFRTLQRPPTKEVSTSLAPVFAPGAAVVAPTLTMHVSDKMRADAAIMKEKRKLLETRALVAPTKTPNQKGLGKGGAEGNKQ